MRVKVNPLETYSQMLQRTEGVNCETITYHDDTLNIPAPDCKAIVDAWTKGRNDFYLIYKDKRALDIKMSQVTFIRPRLGWYEGKPYPLLMDTVGNPRGYSWITPYPLIEYSYPEVIEHEAHHMIGYLLYPLLSRSPEDIAIDNGGYTPSDWQGWGYFPLWYIYCHGTTDDPFGLRGKRDSCVSPYSGPINPNL